MLSGLVSHYRVVSTLGAGGMGVVHKAIDTRLNRPVAIKAIPEGLRLDTAAVLRLRAEAQSAASLDHPYICKIYELLDTDSDTLIVMEFVEGETLASMLLREGRLPVATVMRYAAEIAEGLAAAHATSLVHRDVKPSNVMVTPHNHVKLLDFGIAHNPSTATATATTESMQTRPGSVAGSPFYMAPEQALGRTVDGKTDVFSLGVLIFECLTGRLPFEGTTRDAYVLDMLTGRPRSLLAADPSLPKSVADLVASCLERNPELRPDAASVAAYLRAEAPTAGSTDRFILPQRRSWKRLALTSLGFLVLAVPAAWGVYRWVVPAQMSADLGVQEALVTGPAEDFDPRVSPDGKFVSFLSNRDGPTRLFITSADRDEARPLTDPAYSPLSHVWSPDGSEIAVLVRAADASYIHIISAPISGVLRRSMPVNERPVVSAGARLVRWVDSSLFLKLPGTPQALWRFDTTTLVREELSKQWSLPVRPRNFDVSPDGRKVVVNGLSGRQEDLWVAQIDGTQPRRLTNDSHNERQPIWSRGGDRIVFQSTRSGQWDLWELVVQTGQVQQLTSSPTEEVFGESTRTGDLQAFQFVTEGSNLWLAPSGTPHVQLTFDSLSDFAPSHAADVLAFQRSLPSLPLGNRLMDARVFVAPLDANQLKGEPRQLDNGFAPQLSSDGLRIAYLVRSGTPDSRQFVLRLKDLRSGRTFSAQEPAALINYTQLPLAWANQVLTWTPSGDLIFVSVDGEEHAIRRIASAAVPAASGSTVASVLLAKGRPGEQLTDIYVSPDGSTLSYLRLDDWDTEIASRKVELREINLITGSDRLVRTEPWPHTRGLYARGWTEDGRFRILVDFITRVPGVTHIYLVSADGSSRQIAAVDEAFPTTVVVDATRHVLYLTQEQRGVSNIMSVSLRDGTQRRVTSNERHGVSFSNFGVLPNGTLLYALDRRSSDIWVVRNAR